MDACNDLAIEKIVVMSSAQVGKTSILENLIGYFISQDPAPILLVQPTLEMAETFSKDRLAPMLRDTPILQNKVSSKRTRDSSSTMLHKQFPGGHITMSGANSPASLASRPIRIVIGDEIDRWPHSSGAEGDPVNLAIKRTTTFWNRRIALVSTPTIKGVSRIEAAWEQSDQRRHFVPCPICEYSQILQWSQIKWEKDDPKNAWYDCEGCGGKIESIHKTQLIRLGKWKATAEFNGTAGFHLNELYSPWQTFGDVVVSFLAAKDNPEMLKVWVNTSLGETFDEDGGEGLEWQQLAARAEPYQPLSVPLGGLLLTAGVDVQGDRLSVAVWAWGQGEESWLIYWVELYGDPTESKVWEELDTVIGASYTHESGTELKVTAGCLDSGFKPQEVYNYVRKRPGRNLFAVKGMSTPGKPVIGKPTLQEVTYKGQTLKKGVKLWPVGSDVAKGIIYSRLRIRTYGAGYVHFPLGLDEEFYEQMTAEKLVTRYVKGFPKREWVKMRPRNEALDTYVYSYAAAIACGLVRMDWKNLESAIVPRMEETANDAVRLSSPKKPSFTSPAVTSMRRKGNFATSW